MFPVARPCRATGNCPLPGFLLLELTFFRLVRYIISRQNYGANPVPEPYPPGGRAMEYAWLMLIPVTALAGALWWAKSRSC